MNQRSLERWRERVTLAPLPDGGIEAAFRFEGATCRGVPLTMIYRVSLGPATDGHLIRAMDCRPLEGTDGHEQMCSYFHTNGRIIELAAGEKPLLGEPLAAVFDWRPRVISAACLCAPQSRDHKWSSVLQTIHFALNPPPAGEQSG